MITLHPSTDRGTTKLDWLEAKHSFSFGRYIDRRYTGVGALRVLNHDIVAPGGGFPMHPHDNMEIVTIPLRGKLSHRDDTGNARTIGPKHVQAMSAGNGIRHSEFNPSTTESTELLQIWLTPTARDLSPSYEDRIAPEPDPTTRWTTIASGASNNGLNIHAQATIQRAMLNAEDINTHQVNKLAYLYVIAGNLEANGLSLGTGDGAVLNNETDLSIRTTTTLDLLLFQL